MKRLIFVVVAFSLLLSPLVSRGAGYLVVSPESLKCIDNRIRLELKLNPAWVWGASDLKPGAPGDCTGKIRAILFS